MYYYDFNDNSLLGKLERKFGKFGFKYLTMVIVIGMGIVGVLDYCLLRIGYFPLSSLISFNKARILQGEVWRVFTFIFVPESTSPIFLLLSIYFFWLMGTTLSREWGDFRFTVYYLLGYLGAVASGFITGYASNYYLNLSLFLAFAILNPNMQVLLFFFIPIKVKWLAILDMAIILIDLVLYPLPYKILIVFSLINVILFFWRNLFNIIKNFFRRQRYKREINRGYSEFEREEKKRNKRIKKAKVRIVKDEDEQSQSKSGKNGNDNSDDLFGF